MTSRHVTVNRDFWNADADNWIALGERLWASERPSWGGWGNSEEDLKLIPANMEGKDAIELGCGTGYVSGWMARRGARVTGIDISSRQLETARRLATGSRATGAASAIGRVFCRPTSCRRPE